MEKLNLTAWFPGTTKPVREGVYERRYSSFYSPTYSRWKNGFWRNNCDLVEEAEKATRFSSFQDDMPWRGIRRTFGDIAEEMSCNQRQKAADVLLDRLGDLADAIEAVKGPLVDLRDLP